MNEKVEIDNLERSMVYGADVSPSSHIPRNLSDRAWDQYGFEKCDDFRGRTASSIKGESSPVCGRQIRFAKKTFAHFNFFTFKFEPAVPEQPPRPKDLLCGVVDEDETKGLRFLRWFNCSEQFYRLYTCLMANDERKAKKWFRGNYFQTASHKKWVLGHLGCTEREYLLSVPDKALGFAPDSLEQKRLARETNVTQKVFFEQESMKRFWNLRTEPLSTEWVHVYCAIALMAKCKTLPYPNNVPKNVRGQFYPRWHLEDSFVVKFLLSHAPASPL